MKQFILKITAFAVFVLVLGMGFHFAISTWVEHGDYYELPQKEKYVILGHSHTACAFNHHYISDLYNVAQSAEGYPYTYFKLKKILETNKQVEAVFVEYTNNQIESGAKWRIHGEYLSLNVARCYPIMDETAIIDIFSMADTMSDINTSLRISLKNNLEFLSSKNSNYIRRYWTDGRKETGLFTDSLQPQNPIYNPDVVVEMNISYLEKMIPLCEEHNVSLYFVRSPLVATINMRNEEKFKEILNERLTGVPFLDFKEYPSYFADFGNSTHLNTVGAIRFSTFFNNLLKSGLLDSEDPSKTVASAIELERRKLTHTQ